MLGLAIARGFVGQERVEPRHYVARLIQTLACDGDSARALLRGPPLLDGLGLHPADQCDLFLREQGARAQLPDVRVAVMTSSASMAVLLDVRRVGVTRSTSAGAIFAAREGLVIARHRQSSDPLRNAVSGHLRSSKWTPERACDPLPSYRAETRKAP